MISGKNSFLKGTMLFIWAILIIISLVAGCFAPIWWMIVGSIINSLISIYWLIALYKYWSTKNTKLINWIIKL